METDTWEQVVIFRCTPKHTVSGFTRARAVIEAKDGGAFAYFDGSIQGTFKELKPNVKIVQNWRFNDWPDGCFCLVDMTLSASGQDCVKLSLKQVGIPVRDKFGNSNQADKVKSGWEEFFWYRIEKLLGIPREKTEC